MRREVYDAVLLEVSARRGRSVRGEVERFETAVPRRELHYLIGFLAAKTQSSETIQTRFFSGALYVTALLRWRRIGNALLAW
jgi:hypothetical protein